MRRMDHKRISEELQNVLGYIGELIDEGEVRMSNNELHELYEWLSDIMSDHYEICNSE
jgi:hypothetical protein